MRPRRLRGGGAVRVLAVVGGVLLAAWTLPVTVRAGRAVEAEPPWLRLRAIPERALVYGDGPLADAVIRLELVNRTTHRVRIDEVRLLFLGGERVLESRRLGREFFRDELFPRAIRIDRGRRVEWPAICVSAPPAGTDRLRFEFVLWGSRKLRRHQHNQDLEIPLDYAANPVTLQLPFDGYWRVSQGHTCRTNHRIGGFGGEFSWDFVALGPDGHSVRDEYEIAQRNVDAYSFGRLLLSPVSGRVVSVRNDVGDNQGLTDYPRRSLVETLRDPDWIFGNYLVVETAQGHYVLLGHLKRGSILVSPGESVTAQQVVARCGNSGNTFEPHVHVQVMDRADPADPEVRGLPAAFVDYIEYTVVRDGDRQDLLRESRDRGDPPEGSVVTTRSGSVVPLPRSRAD